MLCQVHGHPHLRLPQAQDTQAHGVITMEAKAQRAQDCEQDSIKLAATAITAVELRELSLQVPSVSPGPAMPCLCHLVLSKQPRT
jgi:hypothetical protein